jgi:UDP-glucose 4-epimerase
VKIISSCISNKVLHPEPVNLAYGNKISLNQVVEILKRFFPKLKVKYSQARSGDIFHSENNPELIKSLYPKVVAKKFEDSLLETVGWFKSKQK